MSLSSRELTVRSAKDNLNHSISPFISVDQ
jgi:hypothetical protein